MITMSAKQAEMVAKIISMEDHQGYVTIAPWRKHMVRVRFHGKWYQYFINIKGFGYKRAAPHDELSRTG